MVFLSRFLCVRKDWTKKVVYDGFWRRRQMLKLSATFYGRSRNCFRLAIRRVQKTLLLVTRSRRLKKEQFKRIWEERLDAGTRELGHIPEGSRTMLEALSRSQVLLNRQVLSNLAIWEPRTFAALDKIAAKKAHDEKLARYLGPFPKGILGKL